MRIMFPTLSLLILSFCVVNTPAYAQEELKDNIKTVIKAVKVKYDPAYIGTYPKNLTVKIVGSRNDIYYKLTDQHYGQTVKYQPNTPVTIGLGASYRGIGVTVGFRTGIVKGYEKYGKTKSFDMSTQFFLPKITINIYGNYYRGYYISDPVSILTNTTTSPYYIRPDMRTGIIGLDGEYIFNAKKFSFASTFSQKQFQKKSAGSLLFGGGAYAIFINGDSSIVPNSIYNADFFRGDRFNKSNIYSLIINGGYAYNLVVKKNYFVSGALNLGGGLSYTSLANTVSGNRDDKLGTQLDVALRLGTGYNSSRTFIGFQYLLLITKNMTPIPSTREDFGVSSYRMTFARRLKFREKHIDKAMKQLTK